MGNKARIEKDLTEGPLEMGAPFECPEGCGFAAPNRKNLKKHVKEEHE